MSKYDSVNLLQDTVWRKRTLGVLPRQSGKTTLLCHEVCAQIELGNQKHIFIDLGNHRDPIFLRLALNKAFQEHNLFFKWKNLTCYVNDTEVHIINKSFLKDSLVGYKDYVEFKDE